MQTLTEWLPLLNFAVTLIIIPAYKLVVSMQKTIENQQSEITELKNINEKLFVEISLLKELVFSTIPPEELKKHLLCHIKSGDSK